MWRNSDSAQIFVLITFTTSHRPPERWGLPQQSCDFCNMYFRKPHARCRRTFNRGSQQPAHADFAFVYNQKDIAFLAASWIPLENVHPDSGPLAYYPGTHNVVKFGFYDFGEGEIIMTDGTNLMSATEFGVWLNEEIARGKYQRRVFLPKRGDVLIWHTALVHEGSQIANKALTRKSVVTHYSAFSQMPDTHIIRDAAGKPKLFMVNGGAVFQHPWVDYARQL